MAIRYLIFAALVASAFSAQARPVLAAESSANVKAPFAAASASVLLATVAIGQQQTFMPHAVEHFFMFVAAPVADTASVMLAMVGQSPAPAVFAAPVPSAVASFVPTAAAAAIAAPQLAAVADASPALLAPQSAALEMKSDLMDELAAPAGNADLALADGPLQLLPLALDANAVPEPGSAALMLAGLAGAGFMSRRRRSR